MRVASEQSSFLSPSRAAAASPGNGRPRPVALDRRALLGGGLAVVAGAGMATLGMSATADAATAPAVPVVYGPAPSGGDDTAALQAALPVAGILRLPPGSYKLAGMLTVGNGQDLQGDGGGQGQAATTFTCTKTGAGITVAAAGGVTGGFLVDGNSVAVAPFTRSGGTGQWLGRTLQDITVLNSAQDGITCLGAQNDAWYKVVSSTHARDSWVLDQGYGGTLFSRCELALAGRYNLRLDSRISGGPWPTPTDLVFHQCIVEYTRTSSVSVAYLNSASTVKFDHTSFYASTSITGPVIDITGNSIAITFVDAVVQGSTRSSGVGIRLDAGCAISFGGDTLFEDVASAVYLRAGNPTVDVKGRLTWTGVTQRWDADPGQNPQSCVANNQSEIIVSEREHPSDFAYISSNPAGGGYYAFESATGRRTWGSGNDWIGDVSLDRRATGVLGVDSDQLLATGYGGSSTRPAVTGEMCGSLRFNTESKQLEVTDGGIWYAPTMKSQLFTASGAWIVPPGVTSLRLKAYGAGGGGGGAGNIGALSLAPACFGGTGGGAGMVIEIGVAVTPGDTLTVVVGAGGVGGAGAAPSSGVTGNDGAAGTAGGTTSVTDGSGHVLVTAAGGGGGALGPGTSATAAVAPWGAGAWGSTGLSYWVSSPGCGSFANFDAIPGVQGVCGGASGALSTGSTGGAAGWGVVGFAQAAVAGLATNKTADGSPGAASSLPGCGGNGGGAGGIGGAGGAGAAGCAGIVEIWWVS